MLRWDTQVQLGGTFQRGCHHPGPWLWTQTAWGPSRSHLATCCLWTFSDIVQPRAGHRASAQLCHLSQWRVPSR